MLEHLLKIARVLADYAESPVIQNAAREIVHELAPEPVAELVDETATVADHALDVLAPVPGTVAEAPVAPDAPVIPELPPVLPEPVPPVELVPAAPVEPVAAPEVDPRDAEIADLKAQLATVIAHLNALTTVATDTAPSDPADTVVTQ